MHHILDYHLAGAANVAGLVGVVSGGATTALGWALLCAATSIVAIIRVVRKPVEEWAHGNWSKLAWVAVVISLGLPVAGIPVPVGALAALWRTRHTPQPHGTGRLPSGQGSRDWPFPWGTK